MILITYSFSRLILLVKVHYRFKRRFALKKQKKMKMNLNYEHIIDVISIRSHLGVILLFILRNSG